MRRELALGKGYKISLYCLQVPDIIVEIFANLTLLFWQLSTLQGRTQELVYPQQPTTYVSGSVFLPNILPNLHLNSTHFYVPAS